MPNVPQRRSKRNGLGLCEPPSDSPSTDRIKTSEDKSFNRRRRLWGKRANQPDSPAITASIVVRAWGNQRTGWGAFRVFHRFHGRRKNAAPPGGAALPLLAAASAGVFQGLPQTLQRSAIPRQRGCVAVQTGSGGSIPLPVQAQGPASHRWRVARSRGQRPGPHGCLIHSRALGGRCVASARASTQATVVGSRLCGLAERLCCGVPSPGSGAHRQWRQGTGG